MHFWVLQWMHYDYNTYTQFIICSLKNVVIKLNYNSIIYMCVLKFVVIFDKKNCLVTGGIL